MLVIGLTGGIASGKSTVSTLLKSYSIPLIDLDVIAREVLEPGSSTYSQVVQEFGESIVVESNVPSDEAAGGRIDRDRLRDLIFKDERKRRKLNAIVHPAIRKKLFWDLARYWVKGNPFCVIDAPLLIETGLWKICGHIVVVYCSDQLQLQRLLSRNPNLSENEARSMISSQMPLSSKLLYADTVIDNSGPPSDLEAQVEKLVAKARKQAGWGWVVSWLVPPVGLISGGLTVLWRSSVHGVGKKRKRNRNGRRGSSGRRLSRSEGMEMRQAGSNSVRSFR